VARAKRIGLEAETGPGGRPVVVDEQVGRRQQAIERGATIVGLQVEHDAALVAVDAHEVRAEAVGRVAPPRRPPAPRLVARRRLDLDDVGAEIGEEHRGERPGQDSAGVDDPDALERERWRHAAYGSRRRLARAPLAWPT
jgi:hypothetical protein